MRGSSGATRDFTRPVTTTRNSLVYHHVEDQTDALSMACSTPIHLDTAPWTCACAPMYMPVTYRLAIPICFSNSEGVSSSLVARDKWRAAIEDLLAFLCSQEGG